MATPTPAGAAVWTISPSPNAGSGYSYVQAVSCASASQCKAVGYSGAGGITDRTLIESWNGTAWSIDSSPNSGPANNQLLGVSCVSANSCTAVGSQERNVHGGTKTLVLSWNGTIWSVVASPNRSTSENVLTSVSCISANSCKAVGYYRRASGNYQTLILSWNGHVWSTVAGPNPGPGNNFLFGVSCVTANFCKAVGDKEASATPVTLIQSWNGTTWSINPSPGPGSTSGGNLNGVSCVSANSCKAVGYYFPGSSPTRRTLVVSWNGSAWSRQASPNTTAPFNDLQGVSCTAANSCKAVGHTISPSSTVSGLFGFRTLIESWNGTAWSRQTNPNRSTVSDPYNDLLGVSCRSGKCQAVGAYARPGPAQTLIESFG